MGPFVCVDYGHVIAEGESFSHYRSGLDRCQEHADAHEEKVRRENAVAYLANELRRLNAEDARKLFDTVIDVDCVFTRVIEAYADMYGWNGVVDCYDPYNDEPSSHRDWDKVEVK